MALGIQKVITPWSGYAQSATIEVFKDGIKYDSDKKQATLIPEITGQAARIVRDEAHFVVFTGINDAIRQSVTGIKGKRALNRLNRSTQRNGTMDVVEYLSNISPEFLSLDSTKIATPATTIMPVGRKLRPHREFH